MRNQEEVIKTHATGFGGSDAKMFAKIAKDGIESISTTDKKRILVALGKLPAQDFGGNVYTEAGHLFEDHMEGIFDNTDYWWKREVYIEKESARNFKTFAHADFTRESERNVYECKYSQDNTDKVYDDYYWQLQWYYYLGANFVTLVHGWGGVLPFEVKDYDVVPVPYDGEAVKMLGEGVKALDKAIEEGWFEGYVDSDMPADMMTGEQAVACERLAQAMVQIKELEKFADECKATLKEWMEQHGVLSIKGDAFSISYVSATTRKTFDTKKAQAAFPELKDDAYYKTSNVKPSIKITLKD